MKLIITIFAVLCMFFSTLGTSAQTAETFTQQERDQKSAQIEIQIKESKDFAADNKGLDTGFKIFLLLFALAAAFGTAYVATLDKAVPPPMPLKLFNAVAAALTVALTGFASTQFDFAKRQTVWRERSIQLEACQDILRYTNPPKQDFIAQLTEVRKLGDETPVNQLNVSCAPYKKALPTDGAAPKSPASAASK